MSNIWEDEIDRIAHLSVDRRAQPAQGAARHSRVTLVDEESHAELDMDDLLNLLDAAGDLVLEAPRPRLAIPDLEELAAAVTVARPDDAVALVQPLRSEQESVWEADDAPTSLMDPRGGEPEPSAFREALLERKARHRSTPSPASSAPSYVGAYDDLDEEPTALLDLERIPTYGGPVLDSIDSIDTIDDESTDVDPGLEGEWSERAEEALTVLARDHAVNEALMSDSAAPLHEVRQPLPDDMSPDPTWTDEHAAPVEDPAAWPVDEMPTWPVEVTRPWRAQTTGSWPAVSATPAHADEVAEPDIFSAMEDPESVHDEYDDVSTSALDDDAASPPSWDNDFHVEDTQSFTRFQVDHPDLGQEADEEDDEVVEAAPRRAARVIPGHALGGSHRHPMDADDVYQADAEASAAIPTWDVRAAEAALPSRAAKRPTAPAKAGGGRIGTWAVKAEEASVASVSPLMAGLYGLGLSLIVGSLILGVWMALS